jgi:hypothetical protein
MANKAASPAGLRRQAAAVHGSLEGKAGGYLPRENTEVLYSSFGGDGDLKLKFFRFHQ